MEIPCKDCITLAICKAHVEENKYRLGKSLLFLCDKCELFRTYYFSFCSSYQPNVRVSQEKSADIGRCRRKLFNFFFLTDHHWR